MPIQHYGVLKGRPISRRLGSGSSPHYQIQVVDQDGTNYRVAVNVLSQQAPSEVMYYVKQFFVHPITAIVEQLSSGFHELPSTPESGALDFIRGNLLQPGLMTPLPIDLPGPDNDLNEKLDQVVQRAMESDHRRQSLNTSLLVPAKPRTTDIARISHRPADTGRCRRGRSAAIYLGDDPD